MRKLLLSTIAAAVIIPGMVCGGDFRQAVIVIPAGASKPQQKAAQMLAEEIEKRTQLRLKTVAQVPQDRPAFVLGRADAIRKMVPAMGRGIPAQSPAEGFTVLSSDAGATPLVAVSGSDDRGVVFGAGYVLRHLHMGRQRLEFPDHVQVSSSPKVAIRGQQLGYRPKTNAYDAWSVPMWEQYIRDLAVFGVNTVELIPPRSDDAADSPHFPLPQIDMMAEMSRLANDYAMDVSIWYPAMDADYSK